MGLFKKRVTDPEEIERLKAEIASMSARLNASEDAKSQLDTTVRDIVHRLETPAPPPPPSTPPVAKPDTSELDKLNAKIERLASQVDRDGSSSETAAVDPADVEQLTSRVDELGRRLDDTEHASPSPGVDAAEIEQLHAKVDGIVERIGELDQRISSISTELANQITELSGELDAMDGASPVGDDVVDELRDAQTRLAGEQARYQIAFRQDLAELADRLKRA